MPRKLASLTLILAFALAPALGAEVLNRLVLRVNDQIATLYDYQQHREELVRDVLHREQDAGERQRLLGQAGELAYADLFRELLLQSRADQLGVEVTEAQIDTTLSQIKQNNNIKTDDELNQALAQSGMTLAQLRSQIRKQLRVQEVRGREIQGRVKVDEEDLRRYYRKNLEQFRQPEQLQLREIVVLDDSGLSAADRQRLAAEIRAKVQGGASLTDAVADTVKKGTTSNAVDLNWVSPGDLDKNLEAAVWKLPKGAVSEPVQARGGLHIVQVLDRRESRVPPFSEVQDAIKAKEQERVFRQETVKYMVELEKKSLIVANPPAEAANYRRQLAADTADLNDQGGSLNVPSGNPAEKTSVPALGTTPSTSTNAEPTAPGTLPTPKPTDTAPPPVATPPVTPPPATNPPPSNPPPGI
jgi:parvulin-like peptidyl-prolyl isomerase